MVTAPVRPGREEDLRALLATMNSAPGVVDPHNALVPLGRFEDIHVARFVVAQDNTLADNDYFAGQLPPSERALLIFLADCDGSADDLMARMVGEAGGGLRRIFAHCHGFDDHSELLSWMRAHQTPPAAVYVNWIGRTVRQVREEAALHDALHDMLHGPLMDSVTATQSDRRRLHQQLRAAMESAGPALTPIEPRTLCQWTLLVLRAIGLLLLGLILLPFVIIGAPFFLIALRRRETGDPVISTRNVAARTREIAIGEDRDVTNPFSAIGTLKPGLFRLAIAVVALRVVGLSGIFLFHSGRLARVSTIHFARWVLLDGNRRVFFASNYDGSLESYMDDFINKVAFGLNLVFSNGVSYPETDYLLLRGAQREQQFKHYLHRRHVPTDVWYRAYPGLTTADLARNARIRKGLRRTDMSDDEIRRWLAEI